MGSVPYIPSPTSASKQGYCQLETSMGAPITWGFEQTSEDLAVQ